MKLRSKILIGAVACVVTPAILFGAYGAMKRRELDQTRNELRAQGFKTELSQFEGTPHPEQIARGKAVLSANFRVEAPMENDIRMPVNRAAGTFRMQTSNSVVVAWKEEFYAGPRKRSPWPAIHQTLEKRRTALNAAVGALMEGPVSFTEVGKVGDEDGLDLDAAPAIAEAISANVLCDLYYGQRADAWTNLVALTRLVTRTQMLPRDERRARLSIVPIVYVATWQALQDGAWTDQQFGSLEDEWSQVDFFKSLPDAIAYYRASIGPDFQELRHPKDEAEVKLSDLLKTPKVIPSVIKEKVSMTWYRWATSYEDERNALIFLRDREIDTRRACEAPTVAAMLKLPSVIDPPELTSKYFKAFPVSFRMDFNFFLMRMPAARRSYLGTLAHAADAEIHRRILLTALALERFKLRNATYPEKLDQLTNVDSKMLIDFVDGQPLRYRRTDDGHFLLYSIGFDSADNHGSAINGTNKFVSALRYGIQTNTDILWPLPTQFPKAKPQEPEQ